MMASKMTTIAGFFESHKRLKVAETGSELNMKTERNSDSDALDDGVLAKSCGEWQRPVDQSEVSSTVPANKDLHTESSLKKGGVLCSSKLLDKDAQSICEDDNNDSPAKTSAKSELLQEQKIRMEMNKAAALAMRNLRLCEDKVSESRAQGILFPKLKSLLVEKSWLDTLEGELQKPYIERLCQFVKQEAAGSIHIYPPPAKVFNALNSCPFGKVKVVIIGQDPYHGPGQAMGLCFSVDKGIKFPSSLLNIFKEICDDIGCSIPSHGNLQKWAYQGVLLLNTVLTVRGGQPNSHAKKGWEAFSDAAIGAISQQRSGVVFLLWGNSAQEKSKLINRSKHYILKAAHPSGLSAHKGFFNCRHFSQTNKILGEQGLLPIDWQI